MKFLLGVFGVSVCVGGGVMVVVFGMKVDYVFVVCVDFELVG